jgi:hypothetical protein
VHQFHITAGTYENVNHGAVEVGGFFLKQELVQEAQSWIFAKLAQFGRRFHGTIGGFVQGKGDVIAKTFGLQYRQVKMQVVSYDQITLFHTLVENGKGFCKGLSSNQRHVGRDAVTIRTFDRDGNGTFDVVIVFLYLVCLGIDKKPTKLDDVGEIFKSTFFDR